MTMNEKQEIITQIVTILSAALNAADDTNKAAPTAAVQTEMLTVKEMTSLLFSIYSYVTQIPILCSFLKIKFCNQMRF